MHEMCGCERLWMGKLSAPNGAAVRLTIAGEKVGYNGCGGGGGGIWMGGREMETVK